MKKIFIAIPAYRCAEQISRVIADINRSSVLLEKIEKVLIIDNRSPDLTIEKALNAVEETKDPSKFMLIKNKENIGLGGTHKVAFQWGFQNHYDAMIIIHGDHQAKPEEALELIEVAEKQEELDVVLGSRFSRGSRRSGYSLLRTWGNLGLNALYTLLTGQCVLDLGSGLNLFKLKNLDLNEINKCADQFTFNMDLLLYFISQKKQIAFHPISWSETDQQSNAKTFRVGWIALKTLIRWRIFVNLRKTVKTNLEFEIIKTWQKH